MAVTLLGTYAGEAASSHVIPLGTPTAGRTILVLASAAAVITQPSPWTELRELVALGAAGLYRLAPADNTGSVTTLTLGLSGPRPLAAVVVEDDVEATLGVLHEGLIQGFYSGPINTSAGPYTVTATGANGRHLVAWMPTGQSGAAFPLPAVTAVSAGWTLLGQSESAGTTFERARVAVAYRDVEDLTDETVVATVDAAVNRAMATMRISYDVVTGDPGTGTASGALDVPAPPAVVLTGSAAPVAPDASATGAVEVPAPPGVTLAAVLDPSDEPGSAVGSIVVPALPEVVLAAVAMGTPDASAAAALAVPVPPGVVLAATATPGALRPHAPYAARTYTIDREDRTYRVVEGQEVRVEEPFEVDPVAQLDWPFDWSRWVQSGETITQVEASAVNCDLMSTPSEVDGVVVVWLDGYEPGAHVSVTVTTSLGRRDRRRRKFKVAAR